MSASASVRSPARLRHAAPVFAALGDETRLALVASLCEGGARSIAELTGDTTLTRQAVTKHLRTLEGAGFVRSLRVGRENLFEFVPEPIKAMRDYLDLVSGQWDDALGRLRRYVEK
jgi:DNA-binding transcriptional ArsR family regulator